MSEAPSVAVIGGGISGLAAAHRLVELGRAHGRPLRLHLLEAGGRLGGVIQTERDGGFVIEAGPDSILSEKPWGVGLCERLGLTDQLVGTREELRRTFVVRRGRLGPLPDGFLLMAPTRLGALLATPLFSWLGKLRMGLDLLLPRGGDADESLARFVTRRLGREALDRVAQPLIGGIYTADPEQLSLAATMPRFIEMERTHRSIILAMWRQRQAAAAQGSGARWSLFLSFADGLQRLVDALAQRLPEGVVQLRAPVAALRRDESGWWTDRGQRFDAVVVATPAHAAAAMLRTHDYRIADELAAIPYASAAIVTLAYRREDVPHPLDGFGFVVPHLEHLTVLAGSFSSLKYPGRAPSGSVLMRGFVGGALQPERLGLDDTALVAAVQRDLGSLLGVRAAPLLSRVRRWPESMPQYQVGHLARVARIDARVRQHAGLAVAGNAYRGVGIPDCIHSGEQAAESIFASL